MPVSTGETPMLPIRPMLPFQWNGSASLDTTDVDDVWSAGYVGLYCGTGGTNTQQFDDFKIGYDNNSDGDADDGGDDVQIDDDFSSGVITLVYDDNGNLTDDGVYLYVYDAWNRLRNATRRVDSETNTLTNTYLADNRQASRVLANCGVEATYGDGGNQTVHYYYDNRRNLVENRNGSNQTTQQIVWGGPGRSQPMFVDMNGDPTIENDADIDVTIGGESGESPSDHRYFYHLDHAGQIVAITDYDKTSGASPNGRVVERYSHIPSMTYLYLEGITNGNESGSIRLSSSIGSTAASFRMDDTDAQEGNDKAWWQRALLTNDRAASIRDSLRGGKQPTGPVPWSPRTASQCDYPLDAQYSADFVMLERGCTCIPHIIQLWGGSGNCTARIAWPLQCVCRNMPDTPQAQCVRGCLHWWYSTTGTVPNDRVHRNCFLACGVSYSSSFFGQSLYEDLDRVIHCCARVRGISHGPGTGTPPAPATGSPSQLPPCDGCGPGTERPINCAGY